ncbi:hypothetical protein Cob_v002010 [Colletotrichum orbiculare MAFF 240422]|uniref:Vegetative cell wall protein gp1 n=1 Tax=Colletotrichum orbiculare (strain 104-T / ATCC 96160 / CBS 514.97 / LARS 414 / MAFF 240422) TaxID=1213857 RepID=A0A484G5J4_COLOR|nr:hypothetical protein Cob_v002010 [Colletotrichum orbiculare MAFF 240422]
MDLQKQPLTKQAPAVLATQADTVHRVADVDREGTKRRWLWVKKDNSWEKQYLRSGTSTINTPISPYKALESDIRHIANTFLGGHQIKNIMAYSSPYATASTPGEEYYYTRDRFQSATPTPSPRGQHYSYYSGATPQRPATRAHFRNASSGFSEYSPRPPTMSPRYTSDGYYATANQSGFSYIERDAAPFEQPARRPAPANTHARRSSASVPQQRPATTRPASSHHKKPPPPRQATEADAKEHRIPPGYSLKNWDPTEEPILLLGSVFDSNSLGKWIYDWTVYHHGAATPITEMAGDLWLLLIQLAGKIKRADETIGRVRSPENKEILEDFIESGERLTEKLRKLLKTCESPMLKVNKKGASLGKNAGVEFVETLFGHDRELDKTERFMQGVRLFNLRFDANCEDILRHPTA